jgi:hypothetical protein
LSKYRTTSWPKCCGTRLSILTNSSQSFCQDTIRTQRRSFGCIWTRCTQRSRPRSTSSRPVASSHLPASTRSENASFAQFYSKNHRLPRQARDKHRENSKKGPCWHPQVVPHQRGSAEEDACRTSSERHLYLTTMNHFTKTVGTNTGKTRKEMIAFSAGAAEVSHCVQRRLGR